MTYRKGDEVFEIVNWDRRGTVAVRRLIIQSWGKRQATALVKENGQMIKQRIYTDSAVSPACLGKLFVPASTDPEELQRIALQRAEQIIAHEREHLNACLKMDASSAYLNSIREGLSKLHTPEVLFR